MADTEDPNIRLEPLGYRYVKSDKGGHHVTALYGYAFSKFFESDEDLEGFIQVLEQSDQWELHYETGDVDLDEATDMVIPRDGSEPFNAQLVARGFSNVGPGLNHGRRAIHAAFIHVQSVERPPYGGNWYKPYNRVP